MSAIIERDLLDRALAAAVAGGGGFAEVYAEDSRSTSANLDDGRVEQVSSGRNRGAGVRVVTGDTTGYAHTADLSENGLVAAAKAAAAAASRASGTVTIVPMAEAPNRRERPVHIDPAGISKADKVAVLTRMNDAARAGGDSIVQVSGIYADSRKRVVVANTEGVYAVDDVVRTRAAVSAVASGDTGLQTGMQSRGVTAGWELFDDESPELLGELAAKMALLKLRARPAPSGTMPVVIGKGAGGVLFHEACGHGLEADLVAKGASVYAGRRGELVASPLVTLVDDGTLDKEWGTRSFDDEGHPTQRNVLIENGVLTDYMWDYLRARKEGIAPRGNGRRESYRHLPMVRMTNTMVLNGTEDPDEIIRSTEHGVFVAMLGGGQVNTATGDYVFGMTEAYMIENGEITEPIRDGNLIGNGPETLRNIDLLGNDFVMGWPGTCGKDGQGVPVGTGTPTLRVTGLTIGGAA